ncbi:DUF1513 domain-containing protein [uncultured Roseobacter sp.]|uniref:DUF1513 domain-containing protein n=1 Tax=uncultured Roseobacter sp. TaxID=114847 RepID=UPI002626D4E9|nr:DUF1513 domain-containing protein [uncultured Roseobacter sp.]
MASRRSFLAGMLAAGLMPRPTWAEAGGPVCLSAGMKRGGGFVLCGLDASGQITFEVPLPARGHAAAAHPTAAEAVAFARRPGTFATVLDCISGRETARLQAPPGRHFYGHGTFSADGELLFTTENDFEAARGVVGVWHARKGYARIGEYGSGGTGPHDIRLMPDGQSLVVANGGIETHPDTGRTRLNIPTMRPNLTYLHPDGKILDRVEPGGELSKNSVRHLAVSGTGTVAFAMQWQGDLTADRPLLGIHDRTTGITGFLPGASVRRMHGYLGSVAITADGGSVTVTSPRAGLVQNFRDGNLVSEVALQDVCGVAVSDAGFMLTCGTGLAKPASGVGLVHPIAWDNHLVPVPAVGAPIPYVSKT